MKYLPFAIIVILLTFICVQCNEKKRIEYKYKDSDTIYIDKVQVITVKNETKPKQKIIQTKPDTNLRASVERKSIILGVEKINKRIVIQSIDTSGIITKNEFLARNENFAIDSEGKKKVSKAKRNKKIAALFIGVASVMGIVILVK